jgi:ketosteroid isomerase-like protein
MRMGHGMRESPIRSLEQRHQSKFGLGRLGLSLLAVVLATGCASLRNTSPEATQARQEAQIQQRLQEVFAAAENKDFDRLDSYHLYGPKFTKFSRSSTQRLDAAAGQKGEHDGLGATQGLKMRADALKIDIFGNVGIATFILDFSFDSGGQTEHKRERSTLVFVKEAEEWKIVHEHLSATSP